MRIRGRARTPGAAARAGRPGRPRRRGRPSRRSLALRRRDRRLRVVEGPVLRPRRVAHLGTLEVARRPRYAIAFLAEELDEPRLVLDLLVQDPHRELVRPRALP